MTYSAFDYLTALSSEEPPTELIQILIRIIGHDVCLVRRNMQTLYHLVSRARDIANTVNELISKVDEKSSTFLDNIDKYTKVIGPLEELLVNIAKVVETESTSVLTQVDSIYHCQRLIEDWHTNRARLRMYFEELDSEPHINDVCPAAGTARGNRTSAQIHDDIYLLSAFCDAITDHPLTNSRSDETWIEKAKKLIQDMNLKLHSMTPNDELLALGIMCAMLVYGTMEVATHSNNDIEKSHLKSSNVWTIAGSLLSQVISHLEHKSPSFDELQAKYTEFLVALKGLKADLPPEFVALRRGASTVRRSYYSRTVFLVSQCRKLAQYFTEADHNTAVNLPVLKEAIVATQKAISDANTHATAIKEYNDFGDAGESTVVASFSTAVAKIKEAFQKYSMTADEGQVDTGLAAALAVDKRLVDKLNLKYSDYAAKMLPVPPPANSITIQVTHGSVQKSYIVEKGTRPLRNIRCQVAMQEPVANRTAILAKKFKKETNDFGIDDKLTAGISLTLE